MTDKEIVQALWYWDSPAVLDLLAEYGEDEIDLVDEEVEITHWMPQPLSAGRAK